MGKVAVFEHRTYPIGTQVLTTTHQQVVRYLLNKRVERGQQQALSTTRQDRYKRKMITTEGLLSAHSSSLIMRRYSVGVIP